MFAWERGGVSVRAFAPVLHGLLRQWGHHRLGGREDLEEPEHEDEVVHGVTLGDRAHKPLRVGVAGRLGHNQGEVW